MGAPRLKLLVAELMSEKRIRSVMVRAQRFFDRNLRAIRSARLASIAGCSWPGVRRPRALWAPMLRARRWVVWKGAIYVGSRDGNFYAFK